VHRYSYFSSRRIGTEGHPSRIGGILTHCIFKVAIFFAPSFSKIIRNDHCPNQISSLSEILPIILDENFYHPWMKSTSKLSGSYLSGWAKPD